VGSARYHVECAPCQSRIASPRAKSSRKERGGHAWGMDTCRRMSIYMCVESFFQVLKVRRWDQELLDMLILPNIKGLRIF
jgi:hypothetical protein